MNKKSANGRIRYALAGILLLFIGMTTSLQAQVTIGDEVQPREGLILDLKKTNPTGYVGGLMLPNVVIEDLTLIPNTYTDAALIPNLDVYPELAGMVVYNTTAKPAGNIVEGVYMWDGDNWKLLSGSECEDPGVPIFMGGGTLSGKTCFDVVEIEPGPGSDCGALSGRFGDKHDFVTHPTEIYTFTPPAGTLKNITYGYTNLDLQDVIVKVEKYIDDFHCEVTFKSNLNTTAAGLSRANALKANLFVYFEIEELGTTQYAIPLLLSVADCICCPGLYVPGGEFSGEFAQIGGNTDISTTAMGEGMTTSNTGWAGEILRRSPLFEKTGKGLCYYYRDYYKNGLSIDPDDIITWSDATDNDVCKASDGKAVDVIHASGTWRLPVIAELAVIGQLVSTNAPTNGLQLEEIKQVMVNERIASTSFGQLPTGSAVFRTTYNFRFNMGYWSSTSSSASPSHGWAWSFSLGTQAAVSHSGSYYMRCVRGL